MERWEQSMPMGQCNRSQLAAGGCICVLLALAPYAAPAATAAGQEQPPVVINEVLVDPATGEEGDANGDGVRDTY